MLWEIVSKALLKWRWRALTPLLLPSTKPFMPSQKAHWSAQAQFASVNVLSAPSRLVLHEAGHGSKDYLLVIIQSVLYGWSLFNTKVHPGHRSRSDMHVGAATDLLSSSKLHTEQYAVRRVRRDRKDHLVPTPLPWAGTPSTRPGCSKPHPAWPWTLPGRGHPQLLWTTCSSASAPSQ